MSRKTGRPNYFNHRWEQLQFLVDRVAGSGEARPEAKNARLRATEEQIREMLAWEKAHIPPLADLGLDLNYLYYLLDITVSFHDQYVVGRGAWAVFPRLKGAYDRWRAVYGKQVEGTLSQQAAAPRERGITPEDIDPEQFLLGAGRRPGRGRPAWEHLIRFMYLVRRHCSEATGRPHWAVVATLCNRYFPDVFDPVMNPLTDRKAAIYVKRFEYAHTPSTQPVQEWFGGDALYWGVLSNRLADPIADLDRWMDSVELGFREYGRRWIERERTRQNKEKVMN